jgi:tetratricopeptide (TPR) repeat protein
VDASPLRALTAAVDVSPTAKNNASFQTMIYKAVSQVLLQGQRYTELAEYLLSTYSEFIAKQWFNKENHDVKLQMLTYLANSLHRIGKHGESIFYANQLGEDINSYNRVFYDRFVFFYYNTMVLNYLKSDMGQALVMVEKMEGEMKQRKISYYDQFIYVNKAIALHWLGKPESAIRNLLKLYLLDSFKKADPSFRFKIMMMELIIQVDSNDLLSFSHRSKALRKDFKELLEIKDFEREHRLLEIMEVMIEDKDFKKDKAFIKKAKKFIKDYGKEEDEDYGIINYVQWMELRVL